MQYVSLHGSDYEECRLLGYRNAVRTSQETHYFYATEPSWLCCVRFEGFTAVTMKNAVFLGMTSCDSSKKVLTRATRRNIREDGILHNICSLKRR
jgi:hypothetical protein